MKDRDEAIAKRADAEKSQKPQRARTSAELRQRAVEDAVELQMRRRNAQKLIAAGAVVTIGTDNYWAAAPEFTRGGTKPDAQNHGIGSIIAIEGLVELGMTPAQAIVAATRNGAIASRGLERFRHASRPASSPTCWCSTPIRSSDISQPAQAVGRDARRPRDRSRLDCRPRACCRDETTRRRPQAHAAGRRQPGSAGRRASRPTSSSRAGPAHRAVQRRQRVHVDVRPGDGCAGASR